jgi:hypothetical protein
VATISEVERNIRVIVSTYPEAFCFSYYGNNAGSGAFNESLGTIVGDMYFNGDVNTSIVSSGTIYNNTGSGGTQLASPPIFPTLNTAEYESLLLVASALPVINSSSNYALNFDGSNDYVSTAIGTYFGQNNALSVEAWVKVTGTTNGPIFTVTNTPPGGGWNMPFLSINGNTVYGWIWGVNNNTPLSHTTSIGWHKLAVTYDPNEITTLNFYIDGTLVSSATGQYSPSGSLNYWTTYNPGAKPSGVNSYLNGIIDEVSIWSQALTANEILANYNGSLDGNEENLAGYWNFNEGNGSTLSDLSGNGNNGTIYGATWVQISEGNQATSNTTINLSSYTNNEFLNNGDLTLSNVTVNGPGVFVVYGNLTLESNTIINKNIKIICSGNLTVSDSQLGTDLNSAVVIYSNGIATYTNSTIYGLSISNGSSITLNNTTFYGGILNYSSNFALQGSTQITGSVVSNYSLDFQGGSTSVSKGSLPPFFRLDIGLNSIVVPGSYLEY